MFNSSPPKKKKVPIWPLLHGTDFSIALAISSTGFATLSSLDAGWYGRGIYFTSYFTYAIPYCANRANPALIVSYVIMGNTFPIYENSKSNCSVLGKPIKAGHHSHYVCVDSNGYPPEDLAKLDESEIFDEIVVSQESQITPAYIVCFTVEALKEHKTWRYKKSKNKLRQKDPSHS
eukprot:TRINITY_DN6665_c0_g1_i4.p1 TRINITY_DN6665_c0_g1~~TRINITY_DN6665_c0_g1_i4.p1  ORF type:complete len:176 (-),score=31.57 TRINITY_DN6665_c0_g1_i4:35-562(-)